MSKIQNDLNGWLIIDKEYGMGSTQVVGKLKWLLKPKKIGHAGTLDPLATGVLPIALGKATKTIPYVTDGSKTYEFAVKWGAETSTDDVEGDVVLTSDKRPIMAQIEEMLPHFIGDITQIPPKYSALKINGKRAYELARAGQEVDIKPRRIHIENLKILHHDDIKGETHFEVNCSKGTYVRTIGHDMGRHLGCFGHIVKLRRTKCGPFRIKDAILLANFEKNDYNSNACGILPLGTALGDIPVLAVNKEEAALLIQGRPILSKGRAQNKKVTAENVFALQYLNQMTALAKLEDGMLKPFRVLSDCLNEQN